MKTGSCKYGVACKFNHPQPASRGSSFPVTGSSVYDYSGYMAPTSGPHVSGGISQWHLSRIPYMSNPTTQGLPAYVPLVLPPSQGTIPVPQGWISYMVSSYIFLKKVRFCKSAKCWINHVYFRLLFGILHNAFSSCSMFVIHLHVSY